MYRSISSTTRYAAHRLQIGGLYAPYVLLSRGEDGRLHLSPFVAEVAHTIFCSGTIMLHRSEVPAEPDPSAATLCELQELLDRYDDWVIELP